MAQQELIKEYQIAKRQYDRCLVGGVKDASLTNQDFLWLLGCADAHSEMVIVEELMLEDMQGLS